MSEEKATMVAEALGGNPWNSGGDIWLVVVRRPDGRLVVLSDEVVCEYENEDALEENHASVQIMLV